MLESSQFYSYNPVSKITIRLKGFYNLNVHHPLSLDIQLGRLKNTFNGEKVKETLGRATEVGTLTSCKQGSLSQLYYPSYKMWTQY